MARSSPIQVAFNAGELSPRMGARVDRPQYAAGCYRMRGFIPDIAGPAIKRGGTRFIAPLKDEAKRAWLVRFEFTAAESFILEFGHLYIRFYFNRAQLLSGPPYEIASPWTEADLVNADGGFNLSYVQSADVIYIAGGNKAPRKLSRFGTTNWTLTTYEPTGGPFEDVNISAVSVQASGTTGSVTLTASAALFTADMIGGLFYLEQHTISGTAQWETNKAVTVGDRRRVGARNYQAATTGTTGTVTPTHTEGAVYDGDTGVQWTFLDAGFGWGTITAVGSAISATMTVLSRLPQGAISSATLKWSVGAWSAAKGYPTCVTFYLDRLVFGRGSNLWMTVAGDYENMRARDEGGRQTTESAINMLLPSRRGSPMCWLEALEAGLVVGTGADEWLVASASRNDPLGPLNVASVPLGTIGSRQIPPLRMFDSVVYVQRSGRRLRDLRYAIGEGPLRMDLNALADHVAGPGFTSIAYAKEPHSLIWATRVDGQLAVAMFYPEQEALGWAPIPIDGFVECVDAIPSPDGRVDDVWMIVRRTINGVTRRYVELLQPPLDDDGAQEDAYYVDGGITYSGAPTSTITGLGHLEGKTVAVLTDGATHPTRVVTGGQITLQVAAAKVHVGLPVASMLASMDIESGSSTGTAQNKHRRAHRMGVRLHRTLGGKIGPSEDKLQTIEYRTTDVPMGSPPALFTGDKDLAWPGGSEKVQRVWLVHDDPLPAQVLAFMPQLGTEDAP